MEGAFGHDAWTLPIGWLTWLATSDARMAVYGLRSLYGAVRFVHLAATAGFVGSVLLVDLRLMGVWRAAQLEPTRPALVGLMHWPFAALLGSGALLFLYDPLRAGLHSMFLPKLVLILFGVLHAHGLRRLPAARKWTGLRRGAAAVSAAVWLGVIGASTWNHVERPVSVNAALRAVGVGKE